MGASIDRTGPTLRGNALFLLLAPCLVGGCTGAPRPVASPDLLASAPPRTAIFVEGPSIDRFVTDRGEPVVRTRSGPDELGRWTSLTEGPGERSLLTLQRLDDGTVVLWTLDSGDRTIECDPPLVIEPPAASARWGEPVSTPARMDGSRATATATLTPLDLPDGQWVRLELVFDAAPVVARRRFDWRLEPGTGIVEERADLRVTLLGVPVRGWSRRMQRED